jgi:predicted Zn-dependent protease
MSLMLALGVAVCLAVIGLVVLSNAFAGAPSVPDRTAVVRVEPGENLVELAHRVAPGSDTGAVVDRIRALNGLESSAVRAGQPLTVPVER